MSDDTSFSNWIIGTGASVVATLIGTIVTLTKYIEGKYRKEVCDLTGRCEKIEERATKCESDRETLRVDFARLQARQEILEKQIAK